MVEVFADITGVAGPTSEPLTVPYALGISGRPKAIQNSSSILCTEFLLPLIHKTKHQQLLTN